MTDRENILAIARGWLGTPWHHQARCKGAGVDCAQFLLAVYAEAGLIKAFEPDDYSQDWMLHSDQPLFVEVLKRYATPVDFGLPGDVAMFTVGRQPAHAAIVVDWPTIIHAYRAEGIVTESRADTGPLANKFAGFYRLNQFVSGAACGVR
ncbi:C40 family peptidase [Parvibium lacunae]|uniref:Hydrolase n=1 Tax=Parvibium lacunae TaxID=1888893 RepID=A0A368L7T4_9BURK|nr:NlpC/P60 family protein [Parvibium lacunae]RCS59713.1 hydrolase [Parvibium lacunae]